jgi:hypothetical protein
MPSGSAAGREKRGEGGVPGVGVPHGTRELVGSSPDRQAAPAAARVRRGRATCAARARSVGDRAGERRLTCGPAQYRAAVALTGGVGLSAARGEHGRRRERVSARGPVREEKGIGPPDYTVPFWNCLNYFE